MHSRTENQQCSTIQFSDHTLVTAAAQWVSFTRTNVFTACGREVFPKHTRQCTELFDARVVRVTVTPSASLAGYSPFARAEKFPLSLLLDGVHFRLMRLVGVVVAAGAVVHC